MKIFALRLKPGQDLKVELETFVKHKNINAGFVVTCVGSLEKATLRMADENILKEFKAPYEIVSLVGTFSQDGAHLHISLSDSEGKVIGGHVKEGCIIRTTAEIVIGEAEDLTFSRIFDQDTGFKELQISKK
ncbi:MAG: PPC domain-containing DNA-binding protein [Candidatus Micrarchaeota archaeon]